MTVFNPWLIGSLLVLGIWILIYLFFKRLRREMLLVSVFALPLGFTEILYIPEYWNPPSLFNLSQLIRLDIESFIFSFAVGGIAAILYEIIFLAKHKKIKNKIRMKGHKFGLIYWSVFILLILLLEILFSNYTIYIWIVMMFIVAILFCICRPDLNKKIWIGAMLFMIVYIISFFIFNKLYPEFILMYYNLDSLIGLFILGIPIEEFLISFSFGALWSGIYEHVFWQRIT